MKLGPYKKLGTHWWFELFDYDEDIAAVGGIDAIEKIVVDEIDRFECAYSRFIESSLISQLNDKRQLVNPPQEFIDLLNIGLKAYKDTNKAFNITAGGVLENRGYDKEYSFKNKKNNVTLESPADVITTRNDGGQIVVNLVGDARIDFGGFGKGYMIDRLGEVLKDNGIEYFLINGGGDMLVTSNKGEAVEIVLQNPIERTKAIGSLQLKNEAFAASSPHLRRWASGDDSHSHLVSATPEEPRSVFVIAPTATEADIWATACAIDSNIQTPETIEYTTL